MQGHIIPFLSACIPQLKVKPIIPPVGVIKLQDFGKCSRNRGISHMFYQEFSIFHDLTTTARFVVISTLINLSLKNVNFHHGLLVLSNKILNVPIMVTVTFPTPLVYTCILLTIRFSRKSMPTVDANIGWNTPSVY